MNKFAEVWQDRSVQAAAQPPQVATEAMARVPMQPNELRMPARSGQIQHHAGFQQRPRSNYLSGCSSTCTTNVSEVGAVTGADRASQNLPSIDQVWKTVFL